MEIKKGELRGKTRRNRAGKLMKEAANFIGKAVVRATQRTVRFIRWLRGHIYSEAPLRVSAARLARPSSASSKALNTRSVTSQSGFQPFA